MGKVIGEEPLIGPELNEFLQYIRKHGVLQFVNLWEKFKSGKRQNLRWGDEIEYTIIKFSHSDKQVQMSIGRNIDIVKELNNKFADQAEFKIEYASCQVETSPFEPFPGSENDIALVERNMAERRRMIEAVLLPNEAVVSMAVFPRVGASNFTYPATFPGVNSPLSNSLFFPFEAVTNCSRTHATTMNLSSRRGKRASANLPIFKDVNTPANFFVEDPDVFYDDEAMHNAKPDHVYIDSMSLASSMNGLQVTMESTDLEEACFLYDQLVNICPIVLALSAASPGVRGVLLETDTRWPISEQLYEDRLHDGETMSRAPSVDCYISDCNMHLNDMEQFSVDQDLLEVMLANGVNIAMANHYAHLFCYEPLVAYKSKIELDDSLECLHFDSVQSTVWGNLRFKPPPPQNSLKDDSEKIGWRIEVRTSEGQLTDSENAAFVVFIKLLSEAIVAEHLNLAIPITLVKENWRESQQRDAVLTKKFHFRTHFSSILKLSCDEIVNGCQEYVGLIPVIRKYISGRSSESLKAANRHLQLISGKASGEIKTNAKWIRDFVRSHSSYRGDSRIHDDIQYDLLRTICDTNKL